MYSNKEARYIIKSVEKLPNESPSLPTDCWSHVHLSADKNGRSYNRFMGDMWSTNRLLTLSSHIGKKRVNDHHVNIPVRLICGHIDSFSDRNYRNKSATINVFHNVDAHRSLTNVVFCSLSSKHHILNTVYMVPGQKL